MSAAGYNEEDELDALLNRYEQQAAADVAAVEKQEQQMRRGSKRSHASVADRRDEALSQPIGADNKGFKLLKAMGYSEGQRIGKSGTGLAEPIPLLLKQDKLGLGAISKKAAARERQQLRERQAEERATKEAAATEASLHDQRLQYQQRTVAAAAARRLEGQVRNAQQACETLDSAAGISWSALWAAPPCQDAAAAPAAGIAAAGPADELLETCEPCNAAEAGAAIRAGREEAADFAQLYARQAAAPAAVQGSAGDGGAEEVQRRERELDSWHALARAEQLAALVSRLRDAYCYCIYCGCRYDNAADMQQHCPGPAEDDHD